MALSTEQAPAGQLKRPHFHWVWKPAGQPNASWKWQLFGYYWRETPRRLNLVFSFRGILIWSASLSFAAYLIGAAVLVTLWSRNPYNQVGYLDVVLPTRWTDLRALRGKGMIDEGIADLRARKYATALLLLTRGCAYRPNDFAGRQELAKIYLGIGQLHRAKGYLIDGLDYGLPPRPYRDLIFRLCSYLEDYEAILAIADKLDNGSDQSLRRELRRWQATALEKLGRRAELEQLRSATHENELSIAVEISWARAQLNGGNLTLALKEIAQDRERFGMPAEGLDLELELVSSAGDRDRAAKVIEAWLSIDPTGPLPRVKAIAAYIRLKQDQHAEEATKDFLVHFSADTNSVVLLFRTLVDLASVAHLRTAMTEARAYGAIAPPVRILYIQGLLLAGEIAEAQTELTATERAIKAAKIDDGGWVLGTERLINAITAPTQSNESLLIEFFSTRKLAPEAFRFALRTLSRFESPLAADLASLARNRFPALNIGDPALMAIWAQKRVKPEIVLKPRSTATATTTASVRTPSPSSIPAVTTIGQARTELRRIDGLISESAFPAALEALSQLERGTFFKDEISLRRATIHGERGELPELTSALLLYLRPQTANQTELRRLAERWNNPKQRDSALILLRLVQEKIPAAKWAGLLQRQMERELLTAPAPSLTESGT